MPGLPGVCVTSRAAEEAKITQVERPAAYLTLQRSWAGSRTQQKDFVSHLVWENNRIPQKVLEDVDGEKDILAVLHRNLDKQCKING